jgi:uncharacterized protein involved in exopolysaccharide biosynthesis
MRLTAKLAPNVVSPRMGTWVLLGYCLGITLGLLGYLAHEERSWPFMHALRMGEGLSAA